MAFILRVSPKMTQSEIERRFKSCKDGSDKLRWQAVMLKKAGCSTKDISEICCRSAAWVRDTVRRYNELGAEGLHDGRTRNGRERLLSVEREAELSSAIQDDSPDGGLWSGPKVAEWIAERTGLADIDPSTGNNYIRRLGFSKQVPRPKHPDADEEAQEAFKRGGFKVVLTTSFEQTPVRTSKSGRKRRPGSG